MCFLHNVGMCWYLWLLHSVTYETQCFHVFNVGPCCDCSIYELIETNSLVLNLSHLLLIQTCKTCWVGDVLPRRLHVLPPKYCLQTGCLAFSGSSLGDINLFLALWASILFCSRVLTWKTRSAAERGEERRSTPPLSLQEHTSRLHHSDVSPPKQRK